MMGTMGTLRIDADEMYPVYSVRPDGGYEVEVTDEQRERWERAEREWDKAQDEMGELYETARNATEERRRREAEERKAAEEAERRRIAEERRQRARQDEARRVAMWDKIREAGGYVYDANGNLIGSVEPANSSPNAAIIRPQVASD